MSNITTLDKIDKRILKTVQQDGRISIVELSDKVGISKSPCLQRLRRLERDGFIMGYRAELDPQRVAYGHLVYIQVKLENTSRANIKEFNKAVRAIPQILTCHMMSGGYDYLIKIRTESMSAYRDLLSGSLAELPGVYQTSSFPVIQEVKDVSKLEIDID